MNKLFPQTSFKEIILGLQATLTETLSLVASHLPLGYAFGAGMVSAVNPCGFAMLPVYISLYIGVNEQSFADKSWFYRLFRALGVALMLTLGFATIFGIVGIIIALGGSFFFSLTPWIALVIGALLVATGIWLLFGKHISLPFMLKLSNKLGDPREISYLGFYLFGAAYGATSMSCTLPIFLAVVMSSVSTGAMDQAFIQFANYILGVALVLAFLTVGIALVKNGVVETMLRKLVPYVHKISALLLIGAGVYIVYYWLKSGLLFA